MKRRITPKKRLRSSRMSLTLAILLLVLFAMIGTIDFFATSKYREIDNQAFSIEFERIIAKVDIAGDDTKYFISLQDAVNCCGEKEATITILKNKVENVKVLKNQKITINTNEKIIIGDLGVTITNRGKLYITGNGEITQSGGYSTIENLDGGEITIENVRIGNVKLRAAIKNNNGNVIVKNGKITSNKNAIENSDNGNVQIVAGEIIGEQCGIENKNGAIEILGGRVKSKNSSVIGKCSTSLIEEEKGNQVCYIAETIDDVKYEIAFVGKPTVISAIDNVIKHHQTLQEGIDFCKDKDGIIVFLQDIEENITINADQTIKLNPNLKTLKIKTDSIKNFGNLTIVGKGKIVSSVSDTIINKGTLRIEEEVAIENIDNTEFYAVNNQGYINQQKGTISGSYGGITSNSSQEIILGQGGSVSGGNIAINNEGAGNITNSGGMITGTTAINNNSNADVIINGGVVDGSYTGINNVLNGKLIVEKGTIKSENIAIYNKTGNIEIKDGVISGTYGIYNDLTGQMEIKNGTIIGTASAIYNKSGIVNVGQIENGDVLISNTPVVRGVYWGIINNSGTVNFYDGNIMGSTAAVSGNFVIGNNEKNKGYEVCYKLEEVNGRVCEKIFIGNSSVLGESNKYFETLQDAIDYNKSNHGSVKLLKNITENIVIKQGQYLVLDMNSKNIVTSAGVTNLGYLEIKGNGTIIGETYGIINTPSGTIKLQDASILSNAYGIVNNGAGIIHLGNTEGTVTINNEYPNIKAKTYAVINSNGTVYLYDGILRGGTQAVNGTITVGDAESRAGYVKQEGVETIDSETYYTVKLGL